MITSFVLLVGAAATNLVTTASSTHNGALIVDLVSPANCALSELDLSKCRFPNKTIESSDLHTQFVPLKTLIHTITEGSCKTQFPVAMKIEGDRDHSSVTASAIAPSSVLLRAGDHGPIGGLNLSDATAWTAIASFPKTCRTHLEILRDQVDVDSKENAEKIIKTIETEMQEAGMSRDAFEDLMAYRSAFRMLRALSNNFFQQLTATSTREILGDASAAIQSLERLLNSKDGRLNEPEREIFDRLQDFLKTLKQPEQWKEKSISDFFNPKDRELIESLSNKIGELDSDGALHRKFAKRAIDLAFELEVAKHLLRHLLDGEKVVAP